MGVVDRRRHGDDEEIGGLEIRRIVGEAQAGQGKVGVVRLAGAVVPGLQLRNPARRDVETDGGDAGAGKSNGDRQSDIAEANHGDFSRSGAWEPGVSQLSVVRAPLARRQEAGGARRS